MYDPANHESLSESQWSEEEARDAVAAIVAEAESAWNPRSWWPLHPVDQDEDGAETAPEAVLFCGASGVVWALDALRRAGYGVSLDLRTAARDVLENLPEKDFSWNRTSYFVGEVGPLAVAALLFDDAAARDELAVRIRENVGNRAHELFTGTPGGMNVARFVFEKTGDGRFFDAYAASLDALWEAWIEVEPGVHLWSNELYGERARIFLGAAHGFAGNVAVMSQSEALMGAPRAAELRARGMSTAKKLAVGDGEYANWAPLYSSVEPGSMRVQWCHGAPGFICSLAAYMDGSDPDFDALLLAGGNLIWKAGPLARFEKGAGLCHGAAGNAFAFLKLFRRTGDAVWAERARAFAASALQQMRSLHAHWGRPWFSLWTGDLGVALALHACITLDDRVLTVDSW